MSEMELQKTLEKIKTKFEIEFEPLEIDDKTYKILNIQNMPSHLDRLLASNAIQEPLRDLPLWAKAWPGALILGRFLRKFEPQGKNLLELGAGMGILSIVASAYGFQSITCSDISQDAMDFARANILANDLDHIIQTRQLDIKNDNLPADKKFDLIVASELLYLDELHRPILKFLAKHLAPAGKALFCTDLARKKPHFAKLAKEKFNVVEGGIGLKGNDGERHIFNIMILEKQ